jgi:argininosuccinate synthase
MCADLGQAEELDGLEEKALKTGAIKCYIEDLREEFITQYIYPTLKAGAIYERKYLLGTSFGRPLIAKKMVEIAQKEGATYIAHGATGKGNDQVRFELTVMAQDPTLKIIAPWKDDKWTLHSREDCIDYAKKHGIPIAQTKHKIYSEDRNIWHISHEGGELEDPAKAPEERVYTLSNTLENAPDTSELISISFEKGIPVAINNDRLMPIDIVHALNTIASKHAIGHLDMVENRLVGMKSRGVYETPGGTLLYEAHRQLEQLTLDRDTMHAKDTLAMTYANLVYDGKWVSPLREALDAFFDKTQKNVTGVVTLKLYKGNVIPAGTTSPFSLYIQDLSSFSDSDMYDQKDAKGFITLFGLPMKIQGLVDRKGS